MPVNSFDDYPMSWRPSLAGARGPLYRALADLLAADIAAGRLLPGTKLPPQRELADFLDVNPSTVSKAFKLCAERGLVAASVGSGTYVASDAGSPGVRVCERREGVIDLGALVPAATPNELVCRRAEEVLRLPDAVELLSYGMPEGTLRHRAAGATWLGLAGVGARPEEVLPAAGGQNAIVAVFATLFSRGDRVGCDALTYPGVKDAAKLLGIQLVPVRGGADGTMSAEGLAFAARNEGIRGVYVIPSYHNPTGRTFGSAECAELAAVARAEGLLVVEDGINALLAPDPVRPIASLLPGQTVYLSSLSKTVAPGLRTAFVRVPAAWRGEMTEALGALNVSLPPLLATVAASLIEDGTATEVLRQRRRDLCERNRLLDEVLGGWLEPCGDTAPLRWLHLPAHFTGRAFEVCARQAGVLVFGAERFAVGGGPVPRGVRLAVTAAPTVDELAEGARRLRAVLEA